MLLFRQAIFCSVLKVILLVSSEENTTVATTEATTTTTTTAKHDPTKPFSFVSSAKLNVYDTIVRVGSTFSFDCSVTSFANPPSITWFKDDVNVQEKNFRFYHYNLSDTFMLLFEDLLLSDVGTYRCIVSDRKAFNISKTFTLNVEGNGELELVSPQHKDMILSSSDASSVTLECQVKGDEDIPKFYQWNYYKPILKSSDQELVKQQRVWTSKEGTKYLIKTLKRDQCFSSLTLTNLKNADSGMYTCVAFNKRGFVNATTNIMISEDENEKKLTIIISVTCACVVLLLLLASPFLWRKFKSKRRRERSHTYRYKSSLSQEPQGLM